MATSKPCEITEPETGRQGLCTDATHERSSADADKFSLIKTNSTSDTLELARLDRESQETNSTFDTLELAKLDRERQGPWECEYSYGGEADLHRHLDRCEKNPGHKNFIPVHELKIEHLPESHRDEDIIDYIRTMSDLTVRVTVKYVSDKRPANVPGSRHPFLGYDVRGQQRMTVGTGWVDDVRVDNNRYPGSCKCKECRNSSTPEMNFAMIEITTAAHVVFDHLEGEHTTCHLFFDRGGTPDCCSDVVTLTGMSWVRTVVTNDKSYMEHYTHDLDLARRLKKTIERKKDQCEKVLSKLQQVYRYKLRLGAQDRQPLLFIVSHPHGCSKQVSIGHFTSAHMIMTRPVSIGYSAATCHGSSGAFIDILQKSKVSSLNPPTFPFGRVHCGVSHMLGENYSITPVRILHSLVTLGILQFNEGPWEDNFCSVEEQDQNQHYAACQKNPGHGNFFPVDKFSMDHLPPSYRTDDFMKLIKHASGLTVRVTVNYVSENRPDTVPGTDIPYPWSSNRGSRMTRVGTGFIDTAYINERRCCDCKECINSTKPNPWCGIIWITTAAHLVYDNLDAEHTTCQLFFDSGENPDVCRNAITLTCESMVENCYNDVCRIICLTHNGDLIHSVKHILRQYDDYLNIFKEKYNLEENGLDKATQEPPLHLVISHPHGCAKQISIGCCGSPDDADAKEKYCSHTSLLCPGSSGATVILPFRQSFHPVCEDLSDR